MSSAVNESGRKMTITWKKKTTITGYQIYYALDKDFKKSPKSKTITKNTTVKYTATNLVKGKTYYVRFRTYKTVGGTKYFSSWSDTKKVTIKK